MQIMSAAGVVAYFGRELSTSEYYTAEHGVWCGKGAERLGLPSDVTKEDFVAIANNRIPQSGERLTARTNDTRTHIVWELDEETQSRVPKEKEVNNRVSASILRSRFQRALACTCPKPRMRKLRN